MLTMLGHLGIISIFITYGTYVFILKITHAYRKQILPLNKIYLIKNNPIIFAKYINFKRIRILFYLEIVKRFDFPCY